MSMTLVLEDIRNSEMYEALAGIFDAPNVLNWIKPLVPDIRFRGYSYYPVASFFDVEMNVILSIYYC